MKEKIKARVATFLYHEVTDDPSFSGFQRKSALPYKHGNSEFKDNLEEISKAAICPSLVNDIDFYLFQKHLLLTFDDGGKSAMNIADSIENYNWKGHFFVTTSMIGTDTFLSKKDIIDLHQRGHVIGSHSHTHPDIFYDLSYSQMLEEWQISVDILSEIIQTEVTCASIPGGEMNFNSQLSAQEVGMNYLFTSEPTLVPWKLKNLICLGRVCPKKGTALNKVNNFANHKGFFKEKSMRMIKNQIKKIYFPVRKVIG